MVKPLRVFKFKVMLGGVYSILVYDFQSGVEVDVIDGSGELLIQYSNVVNEHLVIHTPFLYLEVRDDFTINSFLDSVERLINTPFCEVVG